MALEGQDERRKHKRVPFIKEVEVVGLGEYRSSDISISGMYLESMQHFPIGTQLELRFKIDDSDAKPITVRARVLYAQESVGLGLDFVDINPDDRGRILKFVEQG